jgi:hypothetical protein
MVLTFSFQFEKNNFRKHTWRRWGWGAGAVVSRVDERDVLFWQEYRCFKTHSLSFQESWFPDNMTSAQHERETGSRKTTQSIQRSKETDDNRFKVNRRVVDRMETSVIIERRKKTTFDSWGEWTVEQNRTNWSFRFVRLSLSCHVVMITREELMERTAWQRSRTGGSSIHYSHAFQLHQAFRSDSLDHHEERLSNAFLLSCSK